MLDWVAGLVFEEFVMEFLGLRVFIIEDGLFGYENDICEMILKKNPDSITSRWIAADAIRKLTSERIRARLG